MNKKISQFDVLSVLTDGYYIPVVRNNQNYKFDIVFLKTFITKTDLGLGAVDNTSDSNKPISIATQAALSAINITLAGKSALGHTHQMSDVSGLIDHFAGYSRINHRHNVTDIDGLTLPNMSLYVTIQDMLLRTTEPRVLELIAQNMTGGVDLGPINARIDALSLRVGLNETATSANTGNILVHSQQLTSLDARVTALENATPPVTGGGFPYQTMRIPFGPTGKLSYYQLLEQNQPSFSIALPYNMLIVSVGITLEPNAGGGNSGTVYNINVNQPVDPVFHINGVPLTVPAAGINWTATNHYNFDLVNDMNLPAPIICGVVNPSLNEPFNATGVMTDLYIGMNGLFDSWVSMDCNIYITLVWEPLVSPY